MFKRVAIFGLCLSLSGFGSGNRPAWAAEEPAQESRAPSGPRSNVSPGRSSRSSYSPQVASSSEGAAAQSFPAPVVRPVPSARPPVPLSERGLNPGPYEYMTWIIGEGPYTLGRDDVINIDVRNQPEFSGDFTIGPEGKIQYHHVGDIEVVGLTKEEVEVKLSELLGEYIRVPEINVTIVAYNSKAIYVIGEVARPGRYIMRGDTIKLREAIIAAGLPTESAAMGRVRIITPDIEKPKVRKVNLKKILYAGKLAEDIDLYPGEVVVVPATVLATIGRGFSQVFSPANQVRSAARYNYY